MMNNSTMSDMIREMMEKKKQYAAGGKFPDLTGDGKVTQADILKGRGVFENGGKVQDPEDEFFARPEPENPNDPDSPMTIGFYIRGRKVSSQDFSRGLAERGDEGKINEYVQSGAKYAPKFDQEKGQWSYRGTLGDARLRRFYEMQGEQRDMGGEER